MSRGNRYHSSQADSTFYLELSDLIFGADHDLGYMQVVK